MAKEHAADGIHVGNVIVDGGTDGEKVERATSNGVEDVASDGLIDLDGLAEAYRSLHTQPRRAWTFKLNMRTWQESW